VSGAYIAMDPSDAGKSTKQFIGLEKPPVITADRKGTSYRLKAEGLGSLSVGSPVYFRQFAVGEVTDYALSQDHDSVEIGIFIEAPHDRFVHEGTRFWNASGVNASMTASGVTLEMESIVALLSGGIAFETGKQGADTPLAKEDHLFNLFVNRAKSLEQPITQVYTFALRFADTVRGLDVGAPVEYRGMRIGTVKAIELGEDISGGDILSPVVIIDLEPQRMEAYSTVAGSAEAQKDRREMRHDPLARTRMQVEEYGLRARLQTGSLVTGKRFVDIDFFPNAAPATITQYGEYPEIPTMPSSLEGILAGVQGIIDKIEKADLGVTLKNLNRLMVSTSNLMAVLEKDAPQLSQDLHGTLVEARSMLQEAGTTLKTVNDTVSPEGEIGNQLNEALREIGAAARSIRVMAEYLERHPDAMLKGKGAP
jgi:paraquat-inducible protein B